ncbi:MAG: 4Fe-4S dicluster domain-containing protein [Gammaproteobacteria bacterium]|nr:4Fe-4S dicluster domain-containing protein [Gammaproteobacteria bacterium]
MDVARRGFLSGRFLTREGREDLIRHTHELGPPPPWHRDRLGPETCGDCSAPCRSACPEDVIRIHAPDHALAGTPYLSFDGAGCTYCGDCARACPIEGLDPDSSRPPDIGAASLDSGQCLAWNRVICMSCGHACGQRAIRFDRRSRPSIDASRCNGCGRCVGVCPGHAIEVVWSVTADEERLTEIA